MDRLLKRNGLDDTRHQLKYSTSSSKRFSASKKDDPDESVLSSKRDFKQSRICRCKQQSPQNDRSLMHVINEYGPLPEFERTQRIEKPFINLHHSATKSNFTSNVSSNSKPTVQKQRPQMISPPMHKKISFSSKRQQPKTQPLHRGRQLHENILQKQNSVQLKENEKIQQIIQFLREKLSLKCTLQSHERNKILYVCLQPNCPSRIGCSYCFLHNHENHLKSQISTCLKDLQELSFKVNASEKIFSNKVRNLYVQFNQQLDHEVENIRMEFETNLSFVKMQKIEQFRKVKNQFESYYKEKYFPYLQKYSNKQPKKQTKKVSQFRIDTNLAYRSESPQKGTTQSSSAKKSSKPNDRVKEKQLMTNLTGLRFDEIYSYLLKRSEILHLQSAESKILLQFFEEINSSLTKVFSAFKRNLPKIFSQRILLQKPLLISYY